MKNTQRFCEYDTSLSLWLDDPHDPAVKATYDLLVAHLRGRGFSIDNDQTVAPCIRANYHKGNKGALEFKMNTSGRCLEINFFQNVVRENRNGGEYDFDKRQKMPFLIGKQYDLERNKIAAFMAGLGYTLTTKPKTSGMDKIIERRAELNAFQGKDMYNRPVGSYNSETATKDTVKDGDTVYFKGRDMRWYVGTAYHNINNMWWILLSNDEVANVASFDLHHALPAGFPRGRQFSDDDRLKRQMSAMHKAVARGDLKQVAVLRALLTPAESFYVLSLKHTKRADRHIQLWGQSGNGYTYHIACAGKYSRDEIMAHMGYYNSGSDIAVDAETVERLVTMCDKDDRDIGASTPTLRNTPKNWQKLLENVIVTPKYAEMPEIFTTKAGKMRKAA